MKRICTNGMIWLLALLLFAAPIPSFAAPEPDWSRVYFLGESTTAHLRRRGNLLGHYAATNVLAPDSGTLLLSSRTLLQAIHLQSGEKTSILEAIQQTQPPILILSFGLNGIVGFYASETRYAALYKNLIRQIQTVSPDTRIALQTIYPVAKEQTQWRFSVLPKQVNEWIGHLNLRLAVLADEADVLLFDTAALLRDESGYLKPEFSADGIHLTSAGYDVILRYIAIKLEEF